MVGETRFENFDRISPGNVEVGLETAGFPGEIGWRTFKEMERKVVSFDPALFQAFGIAESDDLPLFEPSELDPAPAGDVPAQVDDPGFRFFGRLYRHGGKLVNDHRSGEKGRSEKTTRRIDPFGLPQFS